MLHLFTSCLALLLFAAGPAAHATRRLVPQQYATVQAAINAAQPHDTVLVAPGRYFENVSFNGRNVVVASNFLLTRDRLDIRRTILDGSRPTFPDTASIVRFIHHEDSTAALIGFTLTGGMGTKWRDPHSPGTFREGGAVLAQDASPTIAWNLITGNQATNRAAAVSAGGGGLRLDGGRPHLHHNVITENRGRYGAGVVLNYSAAILRNNLIIHNTGGEDFGGGGLWLNSAGTATQPVLIENNTIGGNTATGVGGGIHLYSPSQLIFRNNIVWNNEANTQPQISNVNSLALAAYNDVAGLILTGPGNFSLPPRLADSLALLASPSLATDAGDPALAFNDPVTGINPALADPPATGGPRNDLGVYGGPGTAALPSFGRGILGGIVSPLRLGTNQPAGAVVAAAFPVRNLGVRPLVIDSVRTRRRAGSTVMVLTRGPLTVASLGADTMRLRWTVATGQLADSVLIYHRDSGQPNPHRIRLLGSGVLGVAEASLLATPLAIIPNPLDSSIEGAIIFGLSAPATVTLTLLDVLGRPVWIRPAAAQEAGAQRVALTGLGLPAGVYSLRLEVERAAGTQVGITRVLVP